MYHFTIFICFSIHINNAQPSPKICMQHPRPCRTSLMRVTDNLILTPLGN
jgi:hypothetical protein